MIVTDTIAAQCSAISETKHDTTEGGRTGEYPVVRRACCDTNYRRLRSTVVPVGLYTNTNLMIPGWGRNIISY